MRFRKFDPRAFLEQQEPGRTLATLATLAGALAESENRNRGQYLPQGNSQAPRQNENQGIPAKVAKVAKVWGDVEEERAAIVEHDGGAPRDWAEAFARLDPNDPPGDVPPKRWVRFIDDCGRFLDSGWASRAAELGWGPLDLFGCDRERPFARVDQLGLLWLLKGGKIRELRRDSAIIETPSGALQSYQRRPVEVGRVVLAWELNR